MVESGDVLVNWKEATNPAANLKVGVGQGRGLGEAKAE